MPKVATIPPYDAFMNPLLQSLKALGGSLTIEETNAKVIELLGFSDDQLAIIHDPETASQIRDFRGAMVGRADKGLLITTGNFTKDAVREATRDDAPAIDLVDREQLVERLKELSLGVQTKRIEVVQVTVDSRWFADI